MTHDRHHIRRRWRSGDGVSGRKFRVLFRPKPPIRVQYNGICNHFFCTAYQCKGSNVCASHLSKVSHYVVQEWRLFFWHTVRGSLSLTEKEAEAFMVGVVDGKHKVRATVWRLTEAGNLEQVA